MYWMEANPDYWRLTIGGVGMISDERGTERTMVDRRRATPRKRTMTRNSADIKGEKI